MLGHILTPHLRVYVVECLCVCVSVCVCVCVCLCALNKNHKPINSRSVIRNRTIDIIYLALLYFLGRFFPLM